jgi:hypothetical protein
MCYGHRARSGGAKGAHAWGRKTGAQEHNRSLHGGAKHEHNGIPRLGKKRGRKQGQCATGTGAQSGDTTAHTWGPQAGTSRGKAQRVRPSRDSAPGLETPPRTPCCYLRWGSLVRGYWARFRVDCDLYSPEREPE